MELKSKIKLGGGGGSKDLLETKRKKKKQDCEIQNFRKNAA
jgi:hypothetical protein